MDADVLLWNETGVDFTGASVDAGGIGGSELELTQIAEELVARGYSVIAATSKRDSCEVREVKYVTHSSIRNSKKKFRSVFIERWSPCPPVEADCFVVRANDLPSPSYCMHMDRTIVVNTTWQGQGFRWARAVKIVPPIIGELEGPRPEKDPNIFVYASAPSKGLTATLLQWRWMKRTFPQVMGPLRLRVVLPGKSFQAMPELSPTDGVELVGAPSVQEYRWEIARAAGLFYVADTIETFGCVGALTEKFGGRAHILALYDKGGFEESLANGGRYLTTDQRTFAVEFMEALQYPAVPLVVRDFSAKAVMPMWEKVMGLRGEA